MVSLVKSSTKEENVNIIARHSPENSRNLPERWDEARKGTRFFFYMVEIPNGCFNPPPPPPPRERGEII